MAENVDPQDSFYVHYRQYNTRFTDTFLTYKYIEPEFCSQIFPSSMDTITTQSLKNYESCRFKNPCVRSSGSTFCEIVQKKPVSSLTTRHREKLPRHYTSHYRHYRSGFACRKRLQKSQFCSRRHRHQASLYSESRDFRRRRHTTLAQRKAANVREQKRMMNLKEAFRALRDSLPTLSYEKKLSRIDTLRLAIMYINFLKNVADGKSPDEVEWTEAGKP